MSWTPEAVYSTESAVTEQSVAEQSVAEQSRVQDPRFATERLVFCLVDSL